MILAIDIGNTNIVIGCIDKDYIYFVARISTNSKETDEQYATRIEDMLKKYNVEVSDIKGGIISSVVPPLSNTISHAVQKAIGKVPLMIGPGVKTGLNILTDNPAQLGSDLVVDAVAAISRYPLPIIIIDMGTATTISAVDEKGRYAGGVIIPGVKISLDALSDSAAQLPHISLERTKNIIGRNTIDCMKSGIINGNAAMLDGMISKFEKELGRKATVIATGGLSQLIIPSCSSKIIYEENLLLKGLYIIYNKNI